MPWLPSYVRWKMVSKQGWNSKTWNNFFLSSLLWRRCLASNVFASHVTRGNEWEILKWIKISVKSIDFYCLVSFIISIFRFERTLSTPRFFIILMTNWHLLKLSWWSDFSLSISSKSLCLQFVSLELVLMAIVIPMKLQMNNKKEKGSEALGFKGISARIFQS